MKNLFEQIASNAVFLFHLRVLDRMTREEAKPLIDAVRGSGEISFWEDGDLAVLRVDGVDFVIGSVLELVGSEGKVRGTSTQTAPTAAVSDQVKAGASSGSPSDQTPLPTQVLERDD